VYCLFTDLLNRQWEVACTLHWIVVTGSTRIAIIAIQLTDFIALDGSLWHHWINVNRISHRKPPNLKIDANRSNDFLCSIPLLYTTSRELGKLLQYIDIAGHLLSSECPCQLEPMVLFQIKDSWFFSLHNFSLSSRAQAWCLKRAWFCSLIDAVAYAFLSRRL